MTVAPCLRNNLICCKTGHATHPLKERADHVALTTLTSTLNSTLHYCYYYSYYYSYYSSCWLATHRHSGCSANKVQRPHTVTYLAYLNPFAAKDLASCFTTTRRPGSIPYLDTDPQRALLERNFRLLRHDCVGPLVQAVQAFGQLGGVRGQQEQEARRVRAQLCVHSFGRPVFVLPYARHACGSEGQPMLYVKSARKAQPQAVI